MYEKNNNNSRISQLTIKFEPDVVIDCDSSDAMGKLSKDYEIEQNHAQNKVFLKDVLFS